MCPISGHTSNLYGDDLLHKVGISSPLMLAYQATALRVSTRATYQPLQPQRRLFFSFSISLSLSLSLSLPFFFHFCFSTLFSFLSFLLFFLGTLELITLKLELLGRLGFKDIRHALIIRPPELIPGACIMYYVAIEKNRNFLQIFCSKSMLLASQRTTAPTALSTEYSFKSITVQRGALLRQE